MNTSNDKLPVFSIIIVSYNCKDLLVEAIRSVRDYIKLEHEIIVVDNASLDGTVKEIPALFPEIIFIANASNVGFSKGNNQGFAVSKGDYILLLNPDAKLINNDIKKALDFLKQHPKSIIGPRLLNPDLSLQDSVIPIANYKEIFTEAVFLSYFFVPTLENTLKKQNYALSGACLLLKRDYYQSLHGLDEDLFWMDDVDFCVRAKQQGLQIVYFPGWEVVHVIGQSGKKNYKVSISNQLISKLKFFKKRRQKLNLILSAIFIEIHIALRILVFFPLTPFKSIYKSKFLAYCYAQSLLFKYIFTNQKQTF